MSTTSTSSAKLQRADGSPVRVLVVDDESNLAELLSMALRYEGWEVRSAGTGTEAVRAARDFQPDAVVLDMMLPDFDGLEVLRRMRADNASVPVLFLTARDAVEDRVAGLTAGGDDYVTKPFSLEEVVARLRALMRRTDRRRRRVLLPARRRRPHHGRGQPRGHARRRTRSTSPRPSSSCCATSCATPSGCCPSRRSSTACGTTTSAARPTSSSSTSPTCARRSTRAATPMIHTMRGVGYVLKPAAVSRRRRPRTAPLAARTRSGWSLSTKLVAAVVGLFLVITLGDRDLHGARAAQPTSSTSWTRTSRRRSCAPAGPRAAVRRRGRRWRAHPRRRRESPSSSSRATVRSSTTAAVESRPRPTQRASPVRSSPPARRDDSGATPRDRRHRRGSGQLPRRRRHGAVGATTVVSGPADERAHPDPRRNRSGSSSPAPPSPGWRSSRSGGQLAHPPRSRCRCSAWRQTAHPGEPTSGSTPATSPSPQRVPRADTDPRTEVGQVGLALNSMLDNVEGALRARHESETRVRQFVADASHELRTPLASIRGYAELSRRETRPGARRPSPTR